MNDLITFYNELDQIASNTWPAEITAYLDNWQLRATQGVTKRANSVLASGDYPTTADWLPLIEQFYAGKSLPAIFQISDASPPDLDAMLHTQGYVSELPCLMMFATAQETAALAQQKLQLKLHVPITAEWVNEVDDEWLDAFLILENYDKSLKECYKGICDRISKTKGFVKLIKDNQIIAVGTAIVEGEWAGFLNVVVSEKERGQGLSYNLIYALSAWSLEHGAAQQYLQVVASNSAAVSLYEKLGYETKYRYHYRIKYDLRPFASS
ncbi:GNAT family N-acetyltransferase [Paenibacillus sp. 5J-6]|uniref:GNAT family N-acetyltransferase n=1 Tax=Paenibacillus silvestris TaxID=2606219 RepID=A0A6L8VCI3_9BACL|nr:GNAT family N-acetyltransferase [Paenibacillus silvestris]MZQ87376.1 GNAT family N-acetyltransferase [Paenibacillus silvestris]